MTAAAGSGIANAEFARSVVDEWARGGVRVAAVSPGSRSTPLALALAADPRIAVEVVLDERSAAFFALGAAKAGRAPALVLCTSGTAAANLHPAVLEAWYARVPLVVCTADRPPELRDTGAGQAADQIKLFGDAVRWFCEVGAPSATDEPAYWRSVAARAVSVAAGPPSGPVHLNVAFREPLLSPAGEGVAPGPETPEDLVARLRQGGRADGRPWVASRRPSMLPATADVEMLAASAGTPRGLLVAGWGSGVTPATAAAFSAATGWQVMADTISGLRGGPAAVSTYDSFLRVAEVAHRLRPEVVLHVGATLTGRVATEWLAAAPRQILVDPDGAWLDPHRSATDRVVADADVLLRATSYRLSATALPVAGGASPWAQEWADVEARARAATDEELDSSEELFEGRVARDLVDCLPPGTTLVVGSSMPVRDLEAFARPRTDLSFLSNRGVNGIDGFTSTVLGAAAFRALVTSSPAVAARVAPLVALTGDLAFLHDAGALLSAGRAGHRLQATIVVVDNDGGGIFSFLPQARLPAHFEALFGTPHGLDLTSVAAAYGVPVRRVHAAGDLAATVTAANEESGVQVVVVGTIDREANVARHRRVHAAVAEGLRSP